LQNREASERLGARLRLAAACLLIVAYTGLSHFCNTRGAHRLGAALALAPALALGFTVVWRAFHPLVAYLAAVGAAWLLYDYWPLLEKNFSMVYLLQECGMYGLLVFGFGCSLRPGATALCTQLADRLHGPLSTGEVRYTRQVTAAWAMFFGVMIAVVACLYAWAPVGVWSAFVNFGALLLIAGMFIAEYAVRRRVLPSTDRVGILATVRIFFASR
jgi:uncharacterized membrane protein